MTISFDFFNSHNSQNRVSIPVLSGAMSAPTILNKDQVAYARAMERNAMNKRKAPKVSLAATPWN